MEVIYPDDKFPKNVTLLQIMRDVSNIIKQNVILLGTRDLDLAEIIDNLVLGIDQLRNVRKNFPDLFNYIFDNLLSEFLFLLNLGKYNTYIENYCSSSKKIIFVCFKLLSEIFDNFEKHSEFIGQWILKFTPLVLNHQVKIINSSDHIEISNQAKTIMNKLVNNIFTPEAFYILVKNIASENLEISNLSLEYFFQFVEDIDNVNLLSIYEMVEWNDILYIIVDMYFTNSEGNTKVIKPLNIFNCYKIKSLKLVNFLKASFQRLCINTETDYFNRILGQIDDLDFHSKFGQIENELK